MSTPTLPGRTVPTTATIAAPPSDARGSRTEHAASPHPGSSQSHTGAAAKAVVVHSGARDAYQVARALADAGLLERLVTDLWWPADQSWAPRLLGLMPSPVRAQLAAQLSARHADGVPSNKVHALVLRGLATLLLDKLRRAPFALRRGLMRRTDAALGAAGGRLARRKDATLVCYSYYGYHAFRESRTPGILFQLHPHPASMRRLLQAELAAHPDCAESLQKEWELALPEQDFRRLVDETRMAAHWLVASSFTRQTLIDHGTPAGAITVLPYGVDATRFTPGLARPLSEPGSPLRLLFVGRINQRKGIKYLLEALRLCPGAPSVHLTICGRVVDSLSLFAPFADQVTIRPDVTPDELLEAYRAADLFVFPSIGEGFGQVLLEALACGLPILSTTHTAAPDLIDDGAGGWVGGWVVAPRDPLALAERIEWARTHREELRAMRPAARARAEQFTWERFRRGVVETFSNFVREPAHLAAHPAAHPAEQSGSQTTYRPAHGSGQTCEEVHHV